MAGEKLVATGGNAAVNQVVFTSATVAASTNGDAIVGAEAFTSVLFTAVLASVTGTSPTYDVYIQCLLPDNSTWNDVIHFTQFTAAGTKNWWHVAGASGAVATNSSALAANSSVVNWLGGKFRVRVVVGGTNPSATVVVYANFFA